MQKYFFMMIFFAAAYGCVSLPKEKKIDLDAASFAKVKNIAVWATRVRTHYFEGGKAQELNWWHCQREEKSKIVGTVVLFLPRQAHYPASNFCHSVLAKTLASHGYSSAVMIDEDDLSGADISLKQDLKKANAWWRALKRRQVIRDGQKTGVLSLGMASIAGIFSSKNAQVPIDLLIFGGGAYDLMAMQNARPKTPQPYLENISKDFTSGLEDFSIAYDFEWLAKDIWLFHCENDTTSRYDQAEEFSNALRTAEFKVKWRPLTSCGTWLKSEEISHIMNYFFDL